MILIISTCREKLSELEFAVPVQNLIPESKVINYNAIKKKDILAADKIIITGTALKDFEYLNHNFSWLKKFRKPVLGICAGMQIIAKVFGAKLIDCKNIGVKKIKILKENQLAYADFNAYFLHTKTIQGGEFEVLATVDGAPAIIKHNQKNIYCCIFHPEVLNAEIIRNFVA